MSKTQTSLDVRLKDPLDGELCTIVIFWGKIGLLTFTPTSIGDCDDSVEKVMIAEARGFDGGVVVSVVGGDNFSSESGISSKLSEAGASFLSVSPLITSSAISS